MALQDLKISLEAIRAANSNPFNVVLDAIGEPSRETIDVRENHKRALEFYVRSVKNCEEYHRKYDK